MPCLNLTDKWFHPAPFDFRSPNCKLVNVAGLLFVEKFLFAPRQALWRGFKSILSHYHLVRAFVLCAEFGAGSHHSVRPHRGHGPEWSKLISKLESIPACTSFRCLQASSWVDVMCLGLYMISHTFAATPGIVWDVCFTRQPKQFFGFSRRGGDACTLLSPSGSWINVLRELPSW